MEDADRLGELTARQKELLTLVASGATQSKALAQKTGLAPGSIDVFLTQAARALGVRGRKAASKRFIELLGKSPEPESPPGAADKRSMR